MGAPGTEEPSALAAWLGDRVGAPVRFAEPATSVGEGFDSAIWLVRFEGEALEPAWRAPLVLRVKADADRAPEAAREAAMQAWLADRAYPAPRVLATFEPGELGPLPAQVMERAPGVIMLDHLRRRPWHTRRLMRAMAGLQARLHQLEPDGFPAGDDLLDQRLRLARWVLERLDDAGLRRGLDRVEALTDRLRTGPPSVCHGDFHPLNVMVAGDEITVIDWTDAGVGDRHGDVSRTLVLFEMAAVATTEPVERRALGLIGPRLARAYRRHYQRHLPLESDRLALWAPVHLLHGWVQATALHAGLFDGDNAPDQRDERMPLEMIGELESRFQTALARSGA